ncbi:MAG: HlyD family secretion protein, partial [Rubripirellula sp.]|nr:HlyD family secretion protein [Rubripirellula sp.]
AVESAEFRYAAAEIQASRSKEQEIPRTTQKQEDAFERAKLAYEKAIRNLDDDKEKRVLDIEKKEQALREQKEKHEELMQDREHLEIKADHAGLVIYGELQRGKLPDKPPQHQTGSSVNGDQTILTIIDPAELQIRTTIPEANLHLVKPEIRCTAKFNAIPDQQTDVIVKSIDNVPFASTQYDCVITIPADALPKSVRPLMTAEVEFFQQPKLIALPAKKKPEPVQLKRAVAIPKIKSVPQVNLSPIEAPSEVNKADAE